MGGVVRLVLGLALACGLLWSLVHAPGVDVRGVLATADPALLLAACGLYAAGYPLLVARWARLSRVQGFEFSAWTLLRFILAGQFFGLFVPSSVGGDVARASLVAGQASGRRVEALLTVFADRVLGAVGLLTMAVASMLVALPLLAEVDRRFHLAALWGVGLGGAGLGLLAAVIWRDSWGRVIGILVVREWMLRWLPSGIVALVRRILQALDQYQGHSSVLGVAWGLSVAVQLTSTLIFLLLGRALGESGVSLAGWFLAVQVANAVGTLPLTPGGVGGRDVTLFCLLVQFGANPSRAAAVPVVYSALVALWALIGGLVNLVDPVRIPDALPAPSSRAAS